MSLRPCCFYCTVMHSTYTFKVHMLILLGIDIMFFMIKNVICDIYMIISKLLVNIDVNELII